MFQGAGKAPEGGEPSNERLTHPVLYAMSAPWLTVHRVVGLLRFVLPRRVHCGRYIRGSGKQWLSWIHRDDLVGIIMAALKDPATFSGVLNATAPEPTTMGGLCDAVALALNRPNWLPVPGFAVKALLGEGATVVLDGQRVLPKKTEALGYQFQYPTVDKAMAAIVK